MPALTEKDLVDLDFIIENNLDWVALSFVRKKQDIVELKSKIAEKKSKIKVIAKIEMPEALKKNKANNKLYLIPFLLGILG